MHRQCPTCSQNQQNWYVVSNKFRDRECVTYVDGGVVAAGSESAAGDDVEIVTVLVPEYIVLVSWIVVVLVVSLAPDLMTCQAFLHFKIIRVYSRR